RVFAFLCFDGALFGCGGHFRLADFESLAGQDRRLRGAELLILAAVARTENLLPLRDRLCGHRRIEQDAPCARFESILAILPAHAQPAALQSELFALREIGRRQKFNQAGSSQRGGIVIHNQSLPHLAAPALPLQLWPPCRSRRGFTEKRLDYADIEADGA